MLMTLTFPLTLSGWVNTLVGGQKEGAKGFMFFIINVDLTEEGLCECLCRLTRVITCVLE